jgi:molybdenum cofactor cytidylyltransferase
VGAVVLAVEKTEFIEESRHHQPLNGKTTLGTIFDALDAADINQQIIILGNKPDQAINAIRPKLNKIKIALNLTPKPTTLSSFQTGLTVISNVQAAFLILGNQPILDSALLKSMIKEIENSSGKTQIVQPIHNGKKGHPLLFGHALFAEILSLSTAQTIHEVIHAHMDGLVMIEAPQWTVTDFDTPEDADPIR